ncbi:MAG TPA: hypothetical protein VEK33_25015 [Terriglobales bacterium]|nr:hypothetical protein [Terriglobales bacterium]
MSWNRVEADAPAVRKPAASLAGVWRTLRSYALWSHERGSVQYDVMVTLILLFVFFSPKLINFKDKPVDHNPHPTGVVVLPDGQGGLIYQVEGAAVAGEDEDTRRGELLGIIEPISGEVTITKVETVRDLSGRVAQYKVWVERK